METSPKNAILVDVDAMRALMQKCGFTQGELATRAVIDPSNLRRILAGGRARMSTIRRLATALNTSPESLIAPDDRIRQQNANDSKKIVYIVSVRVEIPFDRIDDVETTQKIAQLINDQARALTEITVIDTRPGSTIVDFEVDDIDTLRRIVLAYCRGDLANLAISMIAFHDVPVDFTHDIAVDLAPMLSSAMNSQQLETKIREPIDKRPLWLRVLTDGINNTFASVVHPFALRDGSRIEIVYSGSLKRVTAVYRPVTANEQRTAMQLMLPPPG